MIGTLRVKSGEEKQAAKAAKTAKGGRAIVSRSGKAHRRAAYAPVSKSARGKSAKIPCVCGGMFLHSPTKKPTSVCRKCFPDGKIPKKPRKSNRKQ